jgi:ribonucleotide monophosphatase NagD (HAD superfamily)
MTNPTTNDYLDWLFQTNAGRTTMSHYVALVADATGRYATVYVLGRTWSNVVDQLEDIGCEVVEDQTDDYELSDFKNEESMKEVGLWTISSLISKTTFVAH